MPLHRMELETLDELVDTLLQDILEGLAARLVFEAWADSREAE